MNKIAIYENDLLDVAGNKPSFYGLCASYLRAFRHNRHTKTDDRMPQDQKMTRACRKLYQIATETEKEVMIGESDLPPRQQARIFERLIYRLALLSGRTAAILEIQFDEPKGEQEHV